MIKIFRVKEIILWSIFVLFLSGQVGAKVSIPSPKGAINDFAHVLSASTISKLESIANVVWKKAHTAIVLVTLKELPEGEDIESFANTLFEKWGIGKKGEDKGILLIISFKPRKVRIETGYGVEHYLTDGLAGKILDKYVVPYLRAGKIEKGLVNGFLVLANLVAKNEGVSLGIDKRISEPRPVKKKRFSIFTILILFILFFMFMPRRLWPFLILGGMGRGGGGGSFGGFDSFGGGFGGFGGGMSGGGGASRGF